VKQVHCYFLKILTKRLILFYSYVDSTVLDFFLRSETITVVALCLGKNSISHEIGLELRPVIKEILGLNSCYLTKYLEGYEDKIEIITRPDAKCLRTNLSEEIERKLKGRHG